MTFDRECFAARLAANLRAERARSDISQERLAARMRELGFSTWIRQTVSFCERGQRTITAEEIGALAAVFAVSPTTFMSGVCES